MSGRSSRSRDRTKLSRAELKAYEARRAAERRRIAAQAAAHTEEDSRSTVEHSYTLSRDEEFAVIRSDLKRLAFVVAVLLVILVIATFVLA